MTNQELEVPAKIRDGNFSFLDRVMERLKNLDKSRGKRVIPFPLIFYDLGMFYHMTKDETKTIIQSLREQGYITFHPFRGIKIITDNGGYGYGKGRKSIPE